MLRVRQSYFRKSSPRECEASYKRNPNSEGHCQRPQQPELASRPMQAPTKGHVYGEVQAVEAISSTS